MRIRSLVVLVGTFQTACHVHRIANDGVVQAQLGTNIADQHAAGVDPDPDLQRLPPVVREAGVFDRAATGKGGPATKQCMVRLWRRRAPERHDRIADELINRAAIADDDFGRPVEICRQQWHESVAHALGQPGKSRNIDEHDGKVLN